MTLKRTLARAVHAVEKVVDTIKRGPTPDNPIVVSYGGYTSPAGIVLRGRVLDKARALSGAGGQSKWQNFKDFLNLFYTDELQDVEITATAYNATTTTDEEGFFVLTVPTGQGAPTSIAVRANGSDIDHEVLIHTSQDAAFGVISDIDDTIIRTGAFSLIRNLWTSATGNVHEREVFADAIELLKDLKQHKAAFFYVSSSPWNLHGYLQSIFQRTELPSGPFFLRDLGISQTQFITGTHGDHKTGSIERILAANPQLTFTLIGDTGQHDPHIYADIATRYPQRIDRVILRRAGDGPVSAATEADVKRVLQAGVQATVVADYRSLT